MMMYVFLCLTVRVDKAEVSVWSERPPDTGKLGVSNTCKWVDLEMRLFSSYFYFQYQQWARILKKLCLHYSNMKHAEGLVCVTQNFLHVLAAASDEESSVTSSEADVEYTEVVHPQPVDPAKGEKFSVCYK